jgi:hypothetical protein
VETYSSLQREIRKQTAPRLTLVVNLSNEHFESVP